MRQICHPQLRATGMRSETETFRTPPARRVLRESASTGRSPASEDYLPPSIHNGNSTLTTGSVEAIAITSPAVLADGRACLQLTKELGPWASKSGVVKPGLLAVEEGVAVSGTRT